jgi:hypothetical protein
MRRAQGTSNPAYDRAAMLAVTGITALGDGNGKARNEGQLLLPGQHDRTPVTTKHEKRLYANLLFAVSYGSSQGRPLHSVESRG